MEEKKEKKELTYEELKNVTIQLQQRCMMLEGNLKNIDMASIRLNFLLRVVETKGVFSDEFIIKCSKEIEDILFEPVSPETVTKVEESK